MRTRRTFWGLYALALFALLACVCARIAQAAGRPGPPQTYYVDSIAGDDNNAGTLAAPWRTLAKLNRTTFWPGDQRLLKRGGIFGAAQNDTCYIESSSGNADSALVLGAYGTGAMPVITGGMPLHGWTNVGQLPGVWKHVKANTDSAYALWVGSTLGTRVMAETELDATNEWIVWPDSIKVVMADTTIAVERSSASSLRCSNGYVNIYDMAFKRGRGAYSNTVAASNVYINGIFVRIGRCELSEASYFANLAIGRNSQVSNCVLKGPVYGVYVSGNNSAFYNNTIYSHNQGIYIAATVDSTTMKSNIFNMITNKSIYMAGAKKIFSSNNIFPQAGATWAYNSATIPTLSAWQDSTGQEANSITADPRFRDAANGDYHLLPGSPAARLGANLWADGVRVDFDGKAYPTAGPYSAGAFYGSTTMGFDATRFDSPAFNSVTYDHGKFDK